MIAHLGYYRNSPDDMGTIKPFTEDGVMALFATDNTLASCIQQRLPWTIALLRKALLP